MTDVFGKFLCSAFGGLALAFMAVAVWKNGQLDAERAAHDATRAALKQAVAACREMEERAESLRRALEEAARAEIVKKAKPGPRPPAERDQVVDDATRREAMDRLNMPW